MWFRPFVKGTMFMKNRKEFTPFFSGVTEYFLSHCISINITQDKAFSDCYNVASTIIFDLAIFFFTGLLIVDLSRL
jgi:hypothetical protein